MTPRIFVSSTYYDLKHVRERLELFLNNYGFEPILFESDKVTYQIDKNLDYSAYQEVNLCHVMILIVGGRYGTMALLEDTEEMKKQYENNFISITRKEYETAVSQNIPVLIFVEKNVFGEYLTYSENKNFFELINKTGQKEAHFKFAHVDHINIFRFIDIFSNKPIKTFDKVEEIENYIKSQFSGMFYLYLDSLKKRAEDNKVLNTISELNNVSLRMNEMLTYVGKKILGHNNDEYEKVIQSQLQILVDFFVERFESSIKFKNELRVDVLNKEDFMQMSEFIFNNALTVPPVRFIPKDYAEYKRQLKDFEDAIIALLNNEFKKIHPDLQIEKFEVNTLNSLYERKMKPFINSGNLIVLLTKLADSLELEVTGLPF